MPKTRPPYPPQLRARLIELARSGRSPEELGRQFEPSAQTIRNWLKQADRDAGRRADGLTSEEREEVRRLRREVKALREERDILRNAAAWFARETDSLPSRDSSSCGPTGARIAWPPCAAGWAPPQAGTTRGSLDPARPEPRPTVRCGAWARRSEEGGVNWPLSATVKHWVRGTLWATGLKGERARAHVVSYPLHDNPIRRPWCSQHSANTAPSRPPVDGDRM
jgi:transposase